ncbi:MAG: hypothetical protein HYY40_08665 [Bacteroidetes bacterium]|nr:hypothetical protein [Bacteroidota bacterium]
MNCLPYISTGVLLLAIAGGAALLIKAQKEGLGNLYKGLGYAIMVVAGLALACCLVRCAVGSCGKSAQCSGGGGHFSCASWGGGHHGGGVCCSQGWSSCQGKSSCGKKCKVKCGGHGDWDEEKPYGCRGHKKSAEWEEVAADTGVGK